MALRTRRLLRVGKHLGSKFLPVDASAGVEYLYSKALYDFFIGGAAGLNQFVADAISIDNVRAQVSEVSRHGALSAGDASGKAEGESEVRSPRSEGNSLHAALPEKQWRVTSKEKPRTYRTVRATFLATLLARHSPLTTALDSPPQPRGPDGIRHEHHDGQGANAARHRCKRAGDGPCVFRLHVPHQHCASFREVARGPQGRGRCCALPLPSSGG